MKHDLRLLVVVLAAAISASAQPTPNSQPTTSPPGAQATGKSPQELLTAAWIKVANLIEPSADAAPQTLTTTIKVLSATGGAKALAGQNLEVAFQAPDHFRLSTRIEGEALVLGRNGQQLWINSPKKAYGLVGSADKPRYATSPDRKDGTHLDPVKLPLPKDQFLLFPLLMQVTGLPEETVAGVRCQVVQAQPLQQAMDAFKLPKLTLKCWLRESDGLPVRLNVADGKGLEALVDLLDLRVGEPWPAEKWSLAQADGQKVETVALSYLTRFVPAALSLLDQRIPTLGPATGARKVIATEGQGRLEEQDGTHVLFLKGTPEEMGRQHGVLMRRQIKELVSRIVYGVGIGSSFAKAHWFIGEIEEAQRHFMPYVDQRYLQEMDAMAAATGLEKEEIRIANFFPELFHCSGFSVYGSATVDGRMYHGRVLDYMRGVGLEPNAAVIVFQPDVGHAWVDISYAGFVGSVTAMNEKHISIGEMGGRGEGNWDGKPMAQLVREVMEKASTLEEAVEVMRRGPRTCEYYFVISDGNTKRAVGIAATTSTFEVVQAGESHAQLPHAVKDAVLLSAGDRYEELVKRVQAQHGKLDADSARHLMDRPVCMTSNLHSVLFAPETLDFWVANADSEHVASSARYTHYNLGALLRSEPPKTVAAADGAATANR